MASRDREPEPARGPADRSGPEAPSDARLRVVHLFRHLPVGGAERSVLQHLSRLDRARFVATVCCTRGREGAMVETYEAAGIPVDGVRVPSRLGPVGLLRLARYLRREGCHILHTHMYPNNVTGTVAGRLAGTPVIVAHLRNAGDWHGRKGRVLDRILSPWRDVTLACSHDARAAYLEVVPRPEHVRYFPNAVDVARFRTTEEERAQARRELGIETDESPVLGMVAAFRPAKDHETLLRAFARLLESHPRASLLLAGDGQTRRAMEALAARLGLGERARFLGARDDVPRVLAALDVFVLSTYSEGMPNAILEALAAGLPVVASRVAGVRELLEADAGLMVPASSPEELAAALARLAEDHDLAERLGRTGSAVAERYDIGRRVAALEDLYETLARAKGVAP